MKNKTNADVNNSERKIELLEERAVIQKEKKTAAALQIRKVVKTKTVNIPVTLQEEVLIIETNQAHDRTQPTSLSTHEDVIINDEENESVAAEVIINGQPVSLHELPYEITLTKQVAAVKKQTYVVEEVTIDTHDKINKESIDVNLQHEELTIDKTHFDK